MSKMKTEKTEKGKKRGEINHGFTKKLLQCKCKK
jgi:hypothetical protein